MRTHALANSAICAMTANAAAVTIPAAKLTQMSAVRRSSGPMKNAAAYVA